MEDYLDIHEFMDSSKAAVPDHRHRAVLHSAFGVFVVERAFGSVRINSQDKQYSTRQVAEDHVIEDLGFIPTLESYLNNMKLQPWMSGTQRSRRKRTYEKLSRDSGTCNTIDEVMKDE
jgi:hypothetical protein